MNNTNTRSLSERLRKYADMPKNMVMTDVAMREAADALDAKDACMERMTERMTERMWCKSCGTITRTSDCDCTRYGNNTGTQRLVNYADDLQETVRQQSALLAQAAAALKLVTEWWDEDRHHVRFSAMQAMKVREALAAIRKE